MGKDYGEKSIYILLTDTGSLFTKTIKYYTKAPYNHVSLSFDCNLEALYSFGRKHPRNPFRAGFIREDVYRGTFRYFQNTHCTLLESSISSRKYADLKQTIRDFQKNEALYTYNLAGLIGVMIHYPIATDNAFFCSQFVAEVLKRNGMLLWDKPSALVTPQDFLVHPNFKEIYTGRLYDYPLLRMKWLLGESVPGRQRKSVPGFRQFV